MGFRHRRVVVPLTLPYVTILGVATGIYKQQLPTVYCCWILRGVETGAGLEQATEVLMEVTFGTWWLGQGMLLPQHFLPGPSSSADQTFRMFTALEYEGFWHPRWR